MRIPIKFDYLSDIEGKGHQVSVQMTVGITVSGHLEILDGNEDPGHWFLLTGEGAGDIYVYIPPDHVFVVNHDPTMCYLCKPKIHVQGLQQ